MLVAFAFTPHISAGQKLKQPSDSSTSISQPFIVTRTDGCGSPYLPPYSPKRIALLSDLPDSIRIKVDTYLIDYLGVEFAKTLRFNGGNVVNIPELYLVNPGAKDYKWKIGTYYLCFNCQSLKSTASEYSAGITLDANGDIITQINLPSIGKDIGKGKLISIDQAIKIAQKKWPERRNTAWINESSVTLAYSPQANSLVWYFGQTNSEGPGVSHLRRIFIDAGNGSVLRIRDTRHRYAPF